MSGSVPEANLAGVIRLAGRRALLLASFLFVLCAQARGADGPSISRVDFGFAGLVVPEAWSRVVVWVDGGRDGFSGAVVIEYPQDRTQSARIIIPAAATPGFVVPIDGAVCVPKSLSKLRVRLISADGRVADDKSLVGMPGRQDELPLTLSLLDDQTIALSIGRVSASRAFHDPRKFVPSPGFFSGGEPPKLQIAGASVSVSELPMSTAAFDSCEVVIVEGDGTAEPDPRALAALHEWVRSGGRLVVAASGPGLAWRKWIPAEAHVSLPDLADPASLSVPAEVGRAVRQVEHCRDELGKVWAPRVLTLKQVDKSDAWPFEAVAAESVIARVLRVTERAREDGWKVRWATNSNGREGLIADGVVGLGSVTILGVDPAVMQRWMNADATALLWGEACSAALGPWAVRAERPGREDQRYWDYSSRSAPDREARQAMTAVLNALSTVPPISTSVFWLILASLLVLTFMIGPFDAIWLKRRGLRHWSWATALMWIAAASAVAAIAPSVTRNGQTMLNRVSVVDVRAPSGDDPVRAWQSSVTGMFAAERGAMAIRGAEPVSWWRGVTAESWQPWREGVDRPLFSAVETAQLTEDSGLRSSRVEQLPMGQWTFRTLHDFGPSSIPLRASIARVRRGWEVQVDGLPAGATVAEGLILTARGASPLEFEAVQSGKATGRTKDLVGAAKDASGGAASDVPVPVFVARPDVLDHEFGRTASGSVESSDAAGAYFLPGPRSRTHAISRLVESGAWACVYVTVEHGGGVTLDAPAVNSSKLLARLVVPIEQIDREEPARGYE